LWPVPSSRKIDSRFGTRLHPIFKKYKMHTGVDIDAAYGASIVAANNGIVIFRAGRMDTVIRLLSTMAAE